MDIKPKQKKTSTAQKTISENKTRTFTRAAARTDSHVHAKKANGTGPRNTNK